MTVAELTVALLELLKTSGDLPVKIRIDGSIFWLEDLMRADVTGCTVQSYEDGHFLELLIEED